MYLVVNWNSWVEGCFFVCCFIDQVKFVIPFLWLLMLNIWDIIDKKHWKSHSISSDCTRCDCIWLLGFSIKDSIVNLPYCEAILLMTRKWWSCICLFFKLREFLLTRAISFSKQTYNWIVAKLNLFSRRVLCWVKNKLEESVIVKTFVVFNHFPYFFTVSVQLSMSLFGFFQLYSFTGFLL